MGDKEAAQSDLAAARAISPEIEMTATQWRRDNGL
jgi:hypothetical protein